MCAVYMTLQTIWGYVHMFVYETGRDMMAKGVIPLGNMLARGGLGQAGLGTWTDR